RRRLRRDLELHAGAAHAADERHERHLEPDQHRRTAADPLARAGDRGARGIHRADHEHQHRGRLRRDAAHAEHVQARRKRRGEAGPRQARAAAAARSRIDGTGAVMAQGVVTAAYIGATVLFILALGGLSNQETARRGNFYGMLGMGIALLATILGVVTDNYGILVGALVVGGALGLLLARRVQMTQMPELVAILHSLVGLAAVLVGFANFMDPAVQHVGVEKTIHDVETYLGILIGAVTFSGSIVAFGKLSGKIGGKPLLLPARHWLNLALLIIVIWLGGWFLGVSESDAGI